MTSTPGALPLGMNRFRMPGGNFDAGTRKSPALAATPTTFGGAALATLFAAGAGLANRGDEETEIAAKTAYVRIDRLDMLSPK